MLRRIMLNFVTHILNRETIIKDFKALGEALSHIPAETVAQAHQHNQWFTPEYIEMAGRSWAAALNQHDLEHWLSDVPYAEKNESTGIIMAGNIPFVGLHDLLSVLATGYKALVKLSSTDEVLMKYVIKALGVINGEFDNRIVVTERLNEASRIIATGSNNSSRYFEYYFRDKPVLIRKNRTSVAVLNGGETKEDIEKLSDDIYSYYGLGCRNVTHVLMPEGFSLELFYTSLDKYMGHVNHHKYYNNYMYHKSILLMNLTKHYDNGFMIFQEKADLVAPLGTLNYHFYKTAEEARQYLADNAENIQCVVSADNNIAGAVPFGTSQQPSLWQYADNVNTLDFLLQGKVSQA